MKDPVIKRKDADKAIASARETIDKEFPWIKKSSLLERVYFIGLYAGLRTLAREDDLKNLVLKTYIDAFGERSGDDSFTTTQIGHVYSSMETEILGMRDDPINTSKKHLAALLELVEKLNHRWQHNLRHTEGLLSHLQTIIEKSVVQKPVQTVSRTDRKQYKPLREEWHKLYQELERCLRVVALLETDHHLSSRFNDSN